MLVQRDAGGNFFCCQSIFLLYSSGLLDGIFCMFLIERILQQPACEMVTGSNNFSTVCQIFFLVILL